MKLTDQQQQWLKEYIGAALRYRETFEEVYDHVITALITRNVTVSFEQSVNDILNDDFGGYDKLPLIEKASKKAASKNSIKLFLRYFAGYFKIASLLYVIAASIITYYLTQYLQVYSWSLWQILLLGVGIQVLPVVFGENKILTALKTRYSQTGEVFNHTKMKTSLKDGIFKLMMVIPFYLFLFVSLVLSLLETGTVLSNNVISVVITLLVTTVTLYSLALKKTYRDDLETGIIRMVLTTNKLLTQ